MESISKYFFFFQFKCILEGLEMEVLFYCGVCNWTDITILLTKVLFLQIYLILCLVSHWVFLGHVQISIPPLFFFVLSHSVIVLSFLLHTSLCWHILKL